MLMVKDLHTAHISDQFYDGLQFSAREQQCVDSLIPHSVD